MPVDRYFKGNGAKVKADMIRRYGKKKGESVFYATAHTKNMTPKERRAKMIREYGKHRSG